MAELFGNVTYYGTATIIRDYCGYPRFLPLPVSIQHGWSPFTARHDAKKYAAENWYWSEDIEAKYRETYGNIRTRAVGAPFLYLLQNLQYEPLPPEKRKGSIVFPAHSSEYIEARQDWTQYAAMLAGLPEIYQPFTVCLYYLDLDKGLDEPFRAHGLTVVTNGTNLSQKDFLENFVDNARGKRYAFANDMTSALIYASLMGLSAYLYGPQFHEVLLDHAPEEQTEVYENRKNLSSEWQAFFCFPDCDLAEQQRYCARVAGADRLLPAKDMKRLLYRLLFSWRIAVHLSLTILGKTRLTAALLIRLRDLVKGKRKEPGTA